MNTIYKFLGIFIFSASNCLASDCQTIGEWQSGREACLEKMAKDDECFWNCVHEKRKMLDDSGHITEDSLRQVREAHTKDPELLQVFGKRHTECLSKINDTINKCKASNLFHACFWDGQGVQDVIVKKYCEEDVKIIKQGM